MSSPARRCLPGVRSSNTYTTMFESRNALPPLMDFLASPRAVAAPATGFRHRDELARCLHFVQVPRIRLEVVPHQRVHRGALVQRLLARAQEELLVDDQGEICHGG